MCGQYVHFSTYAPGNNGYALERYRKEVMRLYRLLDERLAECEYLGGDDYSIADITMYPWASLHDYQKLSWDGLGNLQRWFDRVSERPAVVRVMAELPALMKRGGEDMKAASPEGVARFLGQQAESVGSRNL